MIFDIVIVILLALAALNGWRSGAIAMILSVVVLAVALVAGSEFAARAGEMLKVGPEWLRPVIGFLFIFIVVMILGGWGKRFIRPKRGLLRSLDGLVGAVLGFLRAIVVLALVLALFKFVHFPPDRWREQSRLYPVLLNASSWITGHVTNPLSNSPKTAV